MKYNLKLPLLTLILTLLFGACSADGDRLKGLIEGHCLSGTVPKYAILYNGVQTFNDTDGFFELPVSNTEAPLNLLVCKSITESFAQKNEIKDFFVRQGERYRFYANINQSSNNSALAESTLALDNKVPHNTIVVSMDPDHIGTMTTWDITLPKNLIKLPKITLRKDVSLPVLEKSAIECTLCSLDIARWHEKFPARPKKLTC